MVNVEYSKGGSRICGISERQRRQLYGENLPKRLVSRTVFALSLCKKSKHFFCNSAFRKVFNRHDQQCDDCRCKIISKRTLLQKSLKNFNVAWKGMLKLFCRICQRQLVRVFCGKSGLGISRTIESKIIAKNSCTAFQKKCIARVLLLLWQIICT